MRCITKVSVLEAFDPLLLSDEEELPLETGGKLDQIASFLSELTFMNNPLFK
jgi:hypothetical protein